MKECVIGERKKRPPIPGGLFSYRRRKSLLFAILVLEGKCIRLADAIEHGVDRHCDPPVVQRGLVGRSALEPAPHSRRGVCTSTSRLFVRGGIRTIYVHATSTGLVSLAA